MSGPPDETPAARLMDMLAGKWVVQALATAATLGIPDALRDGPQTAEDLSLALGCKRDPVARLLAVLAGEGVVASRPDGTVALTELGAELCADRLGKLAIWVGSPSQWDAWARLPHTIRNGTPAFEALHGRSLFAHLADHDQEATLYDDAVDAFTRRAAVALGEAWDFSTARDVVDVGGGRGTVLVELLRRWPHLGGVLYDLPHVVRGAHARLHELVGDRCCVVGGDFLESVPHGADIYVVKHVIHNWGDADAAALLARCRGALAPGGHVLVVEGILLPGDRRDHTRFMDLEMLALTPAGRERSKPELRRLFGRAGLKLERTIALAPGTYLLVGSPA